MAARRADGIIVTHDDRPDRGVIVYGAAQAWTPNELTSEPPASGMVKVRWTDSVDRHALFWEYTAELSTASTDPVKHQEGS